MNQRLLRFSRNVLANLEYYGELSRLIQETDDKIVMYHSVGFPEEQFNISVERFERDLEHITSRYEVVDLDKISRADATKKIALTFDDGYQNFYQHVLPLLREYNVPATVFVVADFIDDTELTNDRLAVEPTAQRVTMDESELRNLVESDLVTVGNHTKTHPDLTAISDEQTALETEITTAKHDLETRLDAEISRFCYPMGRYDESVREVVKQEHDLAVTSAYGIPDPDCYPDLLPRVPAHETYPHFRWELTDYSNLIRKFMSSYTSASFVGR